MVAIKFNVDDVELWSAVFGSSGFSFGDHWVDYEYIGDTDWDKVGRVKITGIDEDEQEVTKTIGIRQIAEALPIANQQVYMDLVNFDNYDAVCADAVLQVAIFGKVIYG